MVNVDESVWKKQRQREALVRSCYFVLTAPEILVRKSNKTAVHAFACFYFLLVRLQIEETPENMPALSDHSFSDAKCDLNFTVNVSVQHFFQVNTVKVPVIIDSCVTDSELV